MFIFSFADLNRSDIELHVYSHYNIILRVSANYATLYVMICTYMLKTAEEHDNFVRCVTRRTVPKRGGQNKFRAAA